MFNLKNKKMKSTTKKRTSAPAKKTASKPVASKKTNSVNSLENGINVLKYAIKKKISVSAAAKENKFGRNYISDIKARLEENYKSKNITRELYSSFKTLNKEYQKVVK